MVTFANNVRIHPRINVHSFDNDQGQHRAIHIDENPTTKEKAKKKKKTPKEFTKPTQPAATFCIWMYMLTGRASFLHKKTKRENSLIHFHGSINKNEREAMEWAAYTTLNVQHQNPHR